MPQGFPMTAFRQSYFFFTGTILIVPPSSTTSAPIIHATVLAKFSGSPVWK
jgi:hypothetical protein